MECTGTEHYIINNDVEFTGTEHYIMMWNVQGLSHLKFWGTEHYIVVWNVEAWHISYREITYHMASIANKNMQELPAGTDKKNSSS